MSLEKRTYPKQRKQSTHIEGFLYNIDSRQEMLAVTNSFFQEVHTPWTGPKPIWLYASLAMHFCVWPMANSILHADSVLLQKIVRLSSGTCQCYNRLPQTSSPCRLLEWMSSRLSFRYCAFFQLLIQRSVLKHFKQIVSFIFSFLSHTAISQGIVCDKLLL